MGRISKCFKLVSIHGSVTTGSQTTTGKNVKYLKTVMARLCCTLSGSPEKATVLTLRNNRSESSKHIPQPMSSRLAVAGKLRNSAGAGVRKARQEVDVVIAAQMSAQSLAAYNCWIAVLKSRGRPWTMRKTQLPCRLPGERKAMRKPAMVQKATMAIAERMPSGEAARLTRPCTTVRRRMLATTTERPTPL